MSALVMIPRLLSIVVSCTCWSISVFFHRFPPMVLLHDDLLPLNEPVEPDSPPQTVLSKHLCEFTEFGKLMLKVHECIDQSLSQLGDN